MNFGFHPRKSFAPELNEKVLVFIFSENNNLKNFSWKLLESFFSISRQAGCGTSINYGISFFIYFNVSG